MYAIYVKGYFWAEDAESHDHFVVCEGSFFDAVKVAEDTKVDMENNGFEDVSYQVIFGNAIVAYC